MRVALEGNSASIFLFCFVNDTHEFLKCRHFQLLSLYLKILKHCNPYYRE